MLIAKLTCTNNLRRAGHLAKFDEERYISQAHLTLSKILLVNSIINPNLLHKRDLNVCDQLQIAISSVHITHSIAMSD